MAIDKNIPPFLAHSDGNQTFSIVGVVGTMGTSDTGGTARVLPVGVNPDTGAMYVQDLSGASGTTNVQIVGGTFNAGTVTTSLALNTGTISTIVAGTQNTLGTVGTVIGVGTISNNVVVVQSTSSNLKAQISGIQAAGGTATNNPIIVAGTDVGGTVRNLVLDVNGGLTVGTVTANILTGTIQSSGTVTGVGTITNVGSITNIGNLPTLNLTTGTITTGSLTNLAGLHTGTITTGSVTDLANLYNGSINILTGTIQSSGTTTGVGVVTTVTTVSNLTSGSVRMTVGTVTTGSLTDLTNLYSGSVRMTVGTLTTGTLQNLVTGTINALASGTVTGGTLGNLNYGTVAIDAKPAGSAILTTHTLGTGGGTFFGTMVAPVGAGTYIYLTGISIVGRAGGTIDVGFANNVAGSTGAGVIARGFFPTAGGGIRQEFNPALRLGTNGTLAYFLITAGTADFTAQYWIGS